MVISCLVFLSFNNSDSELLNDSIDIRISDIDAWPVNRNYDIYHTFRYFALNYVTDHIPRNFKVDGVTSYGYDAACTYTFLAISMWYALNTLAQLPMNIGSQFTFKPWLKLWRGAFENPNQVKQFCKLPVVI
jgi:hypothetical protein